MNLWELAKKLKRTEVDSQIFESCFSTSKKG